METERFYKIGSIMEKAFSEGHILEAENLAYEYIELASANNSNWNYGNAIHHANLTLGRIALQKGDIDKAKTYLLKAGNISGSPQLNNFGPNMSLAKKLLEKGEKEAVVAYINLTKRFWKWFVSWYKIRKWKNEIKKGLIPNFGSNLYY